MERALAIALRYLNRRDRTTAEMSSHLAVKGFDDATVAGTLTTLRQDGYLDDARFARLFVEDKRNLESWGRERIARVLGARGLERDAIEAALAQCDAEEGESEQDRALAVLLSRFPEPPRDLRERERAFAVLVRKGYDSEVALAALRAHADAA
jgi:regulatory protein